MLANLPEPFILLLWGCFIGGLPAAGYYLFKYGRQLHARGRRIRERSTDYDEYQAQLYDERRYALGLCLYAAVGLLLIQVLKTVSPG